MSYDAADLSASHSAATVWITGNEQEYRETGFSYRQGEYWKNNTGIYWEMERDYSYLGLWPYGRSFGDCSPPGINR